MGLRDQLRGIIPDRELRGISDHFKVIGDIAIISIPPELSAYKPDIARGIISHRRNISTVLNKVAKVSGNERTAAYEILTGTTTETLHQEFGFAYRFDVSRVFFNTRLVSERKRVTDQTESGERVYVPFCGVEPFAIPVAARGAHVVAVEHFPVIQSAYWSLQAKIMTDIMINKVTVQASTESEVGKMSR